MLQVGRPNSMTVTRQSEEVGVAFGVGEMLCQNGQDTWMSLPGS